MTNVPTGVLGNWQVFTFPNLSYYWPNIAPPANGSTSTSATAQFSAGTRVMFYADRTAGTVPAHTVCIQGWQDLNRAWDNSHNNTGPS